MYGTKESSWKCLQPAGTSRRDLYRNIFRLPSSCVSSILFRYKICWGLHFGHFSDTSWHIRILRHSYIANVEGTCASSYTAVFQLFTVYKILCAIVKIPTPKVRETFRRMKKVEKINNNKTSDWLWPLAGKNSSHFSLIILNHFSVYNFSVWRRFSNFPFSFSFLISSVVEQIIFGLHQLIYRIYSV